MNERKVKLELKGIHHTFPGKKQQVAVLSDLSLHVDEGEFVSLIGPSGSGKSTLFHIIGGLLAPDTGEVWLDGVHVTGRKGLISYMPQQPALFPWRSIEANVALSQEVAGEARSAALAKAREWLPRVGLGGYEQELPHVLSGGMQQRVSFLRALLGPQELMCLDEPFGSLDALTRQSMQTWLLNIWEQNKRSILFITHSIEEALFLSDRIYVLSNKPARVIEELAVPFPRPRQETVTVQPVFHELRQHIQDLLRQEMRS
ncbi:ABC transporter ATP-binding protein [Paenibacillus sp. GCM10023248]|uniref:ABC transporter ATP-binding protein n=1 Tax=Bacillales TaxID=1385 RepID=UPI002378E635|nr:MULTISPECIES: ABC transporter ATP-binding protein [Bacillales]MDD9267982.1 ABC transporter ATP-binding protein [Paenibacillus sp. MAHUQ-63]MDR6879654.1 ABC-type nitrate/sulfonate/bicarbonate transport system ATPase subunit [Bacillus sp. 3255]